MDFKKSALKLSLFSSISYIVDYTYQLIDIFWVAKLGVGAPNRDHYCRIDIFPRLIFK